MPGPSYKGLYCYAWDLLDEGIAEVAARLRGCGLDTVTLAAAYHAGKFLRPHGRSGKIVIPEDGTIYFRHDPARYGRVKPLPNSLLADHDPFAELERGAPDLGRAAWVVAFHNSRLGEAHPDLCSRNCFGDPYVYALSPAHPEARAFVVALCRDLASAYAPSVITLETPGFQPFDHGYHHEFYFTPLNEWAKILLGMDFSPAVREAAKAAGIDTEPLRRRTCAALESWLASDITPSETMAQQWLMADLVLDPDWQAFLRWRCDLVTSVVAEIRAALPKATALRVIPSVQRSSARGWIEGSDLAALARAGDGLEWCAYEPTAEALAADTFDVRRRVGADAVLTAIMRPAPPDLRGGADCAEAARILRRAGVTGIAFYNYGHFRLAALDRIAEATAAWESAA